MLELRNLTKRFGPVVANDNVSMTFHAGEVHALLGENGAGKTTLMKMVGGLVQPDSGEILMGGESVRFDSPSASIGAGVSMVHQHFMLIPTFTVAENVLLGIERVKGPFGVLNREEAREEVSSLSRRYGLHVDPDDVVGDLPVGVRQRVEILKALARNARILILDEPTAVLAPPEVDQLIEVINTLREERGTAIVFISHKLKEVRSVADRITVLRQGAVSGEVDPGVSEQELASLMVGRRVELAVRPAPGQRREVALEVTDLTIRDDARTVVDRVFFSVRGGEIFGIAGVQGNGQSELIEALLGLHPFAGSVRLLGRELAEVAPRDILAAGVGYIPEDRQHDGLIVEFSVADNLILDRYREPWLSPRGVFRRDIVEENARSLVEAFDVRGASIRGAAGRLSGGNQQKLVVARELTKPLQLLIAGQPTRGLDVGAIEAIHGRIVDVRDEGVAVVLVSSELDEIFTLADRVAVMFEGRMSSALPTSELTPRAVGLMMAGASPMLQAHGVSPER
jgi:general nucleoside transport system ATP-binding protein